MMTIKVLFMVLWMKFDKKRSSEIMKLKKDKKITDDQWNEFVSMYENHFADEVSRLADEFFTEYKINQLKQYD
jgi:hypothetical protein